MVGANNSSLYLDVTVVCKLNKLSTDQLNINIPNHIYDEVTFCKIFSSVIFMLTFDIHDSGYMK